MALFGLIVTYLLLQLYVCHGQRWPLSGSCYPCDCKIIQKSSGRVKYVNCSNLSLERIPRNLPLDLNTLDLSHNELIPQDLRQLCTFKSMQYGSLSFNGLTQLPKYTFDTCHDLLHLNLTGNVFKKLEKGSFGGLGNIIGIYGLEVNEMAEDVFREMTKLKTLEVIYNGRTLTGAIFNGLPINEMKLVVTNLQILPSNMFQFGIKTLNDLSIIGPEITFFSENSLHGLGVLRKIYLDLKKLVSLPEKIFHNNGKLDIVSSKPENLQEIWILNVAAIPPKIFKDLDNLHKLILRGIQSVPSEGLFNDLLNVEYLDISDCSVNQISQIWLAELYSLKTLKLRQTGIRNIEPGVFTGLVNLQELDLSYNVLRDVKQESLQPLVNSLKKLNLNGNMLNRIDSNLFQRMYNLVSLDISDNKLVSIEKDAFSDLRQLVFLNINDNKLSNLPLGLFNSLRNLQTLDLSMNTFTKFPGALDKPGYLLKLNLSSNRIIKFPENFLDSFPYLEYLNLLNNQLYCDCSNLVIKYLRPNLKIIGTCFFPDKYAMRKIADIEALECLELTVSTTNVMATTPVSHILPNSSYMIDTSSITVEVRSTLVIFNSSEGFESQTLLTQSDWTDLYPSSTFQSTPPLENINGSLVAPTIHFNDLTETVSTTSVNTTSHVPPIFKAEINEEKFYDHLVFRVTIGVVSGAIFVCGFMALVMWRKRMKRREVYEVTDTHC
ncbi:hypothetical protein SNE40_013987 [Patella caerulea]|uniref:Uncharacterized protein n=1 Tax=Patella caerulea TaxID=87958 RepID=A0AAN8PI77_PATCE